MRIDCRLVDLVEIRLDADQSLSIRLDAVPKPDWIRSWESGEALDAIGFEHPSGVRGSVAMRDPEWLSSRYGLEYSQTLQSPSSTTELFGSYKASTAVNLNIQLASAWTNAEANPESAWFAVDKALEF